MTEDVFDDEADESDDSSVDTVAVALKSRGFKAIEDVLEAREAGGLDEEHGIFESDADPDGTRRRLVLLGAGASCDAGLFNAKELDMHYCDQEKLRIYRALSPLLGQDFEIVIQVMEFIADQGNSSIGFLLGLQGAWEYFAKIAGLDSGNVSSQSRAELKRIKNFIRSKYWIGDDQGDRCSYLIPLVQAQLGGTIATLNYDNTLQVLQGSGVRMYGVASDGSVSSAETHPYSVQCLPLHGYLGWEERIDESHEVTNVVPADDHQNPSDLAYPYNPAIIFGSGNKLRHYGPYLGMLHDFAAALAESETVLTIGYSWRDSHINSYLRQWAIERANEISMLRPIDRLEKRKRLVVCTGPETGSLPEQVELLRTNYNLAVQVVAVKGKALSVIPELFGAGGQFSQPHYGSHKRFWCSQ